MQGVDGLQVREEPSRAYLARFGFYELVDGLLTAKSEVIPTLTVHNCRVPVLKRQLCLPLHGLVDVPVAQEAAPSSLLLFDSREPRRILLILLNHILLRLSI